MKITREGILVTSLLLLGAIIRYFFIFHWHPIESYIFSDAGGYFSNGQDILAGRWHPYIAFQPIGMPLVVAASLYLTSGLKLVSWLHLITSVLCLYLIWRIARNLTRSKLALVCLAISTFHYPFLFESGILLSESLFTFFIALLIAILSERKESLSSARSFLAGIVFFMSMLFKGNLVFFLPLILIWNYWVYKKAKPLLILVSTILMLSLCHGLFMGKAIGKYQFSASNGGFNFMVGKCEWKGNRDINGYAWMPPLFVQLNENSTKTWNEPFTNSSFFLAQGFRCIKDNPLILAESLRYIPYLFINNQLWPAQNTKAEYKKLASNYTLFFAFLTLPGIMVGLLLSLKDPRSQHFALFFLPALSLFILAWLFFGEMRFRVPFDVIFIPLAIYGWDFILSSTLNMRPETRFSVMMAATAIGFTFTVPYLIAGNIPQLPSIERVDIKKLMDVVQSGPWDAPDNIQFSKELEIVLEREMSIREIDLSVDNNDLYRIEVLTEGKYIQVMDIHPSSMPGMVRHIYQLKQPTPKTDRVRITAIFGDGKYSLGHFIVK